MAPPTLVPIFNALLKDLINILSVRFPKDRELQCTKSKIEISFSVSPRLTIVHFVDHTRPFLEKIHNKDEEFFLKMAADDEDFGKLQIHEKWNNLTPDDKSRIWKNIQKMVVLGNKILND